MCCANQRRPAAIDNSVNAVVAPRTNPSAPSENPTTSSVTASIASSADSPTSLDVTSRSSDSLAVPRPIVEQGNEVSEHGVWVYSAERVRVRPNT